MSKRSFTLSLDPELASQVINYMEQCSFPNQPEAVRYILRQFFASTPEDGALRGRQLQAYTEVRRWTMNRVTSMFEEINTELKEALKGVP